MRHLYARTGAFLKEAVEPQLRQGKDVLIVGHGAMNASIVCRIRNIPREGLLEREDEKRGAGAAALSMAAL